MKICFSFSVQFFSERLHENDLMENLTKKEKIINDATNRRISKNFDCLKIAITSRNFNCSTLIL